MAYKPYTPWYFNTKEAQFRGEAKGTTMRTTKVFDRIVSYHKSRITVLQGGSSSSKCLGAGTKVIMYDMTLRNVEDIVVGDLLMGPDSTPRKVLKLYRGTDDMYKIKQAKGIDYVISSNHILSLVECFKEVRKNECIGHHPYRQRRVYAGRTNSNKITNIGLQDYISKSNSVCCGCILNVVICFTEVTTNCHMSDN